MKPKFKKELREWILLIVICSGVYLAGWHTEILGRMQQIILSTKLIGAEQVDAKKLADYAFLLEDTQGNRVSLSDFRGKVVFLNFWATWCPPCIAELPNIDRVYQQHKGEVVFIMLSLDKSREKASRFLKRKAYSFPVYFPVSAKPTAYPIDVVPTTFVIDPEGWIRVHHEGMANYDTEEFHALLSDLSEPE